MALIAVMRLMTNLKLYAAKLLIRYTKDREGFEVFKLKLGQGDVLIVGLVDKGFGADVEFSWMERKVPLSLTRY